MRKLSKEPNSSERTFSLPRPTGGPANTAANKPDPALFFTGFRLAEMEELSYLHLMLRWGKDQA